MGRSLGRERGQGQGARARARGKGKGARSKGQGAGEQGQGARGKGRGARGKGQAARGKEQGARREARGMGMARTPERAKCQSVPRVRIVARRFNVREAKPSRNNLRSLGRPDQLKAERPLPTRMPGEARRSLPVRLRATRDLPARYKGTRTPNPGARCLSASEGRATSQRSTKPKLQSQARVASQLAKDARPISGVHN